MAKYKRALQTIFTIGVFASLIYMLISHSGKTNWADLYKHPALLSLSLLLCIVSVGSNFLLWYFLAKRLNPNFNIKEGYRIYGISSLSRYLPAGKFLQFASAYHLASDPVTALSATIAMMVLILASIISGGIICLPGIRELLPQIPSWSVLLASISLLIFTYFLIRPKSLQLILRIIQKQNISELKLSKLGLANVTLCILLTLPLLWLTEGVASVLLVEMVNPTFSVSSIWFLLSCYALATFGGYFTFFAPAGIGVREGLMVFLLRNRLSPFDTAFLTLNLRLLMILAEIIFYLPLLAFFSATNKTRARNQIPTTGK